MRLSEEARQPEPPYRCSPPAHACPLVISREKRGVHQSAGPLRAPSGDAAGGPWFVDANSAEAVDALVKEDPFWPTGLRRSVRILNWAQVFADGKRLV